jgi:hypothetical protein
MESNEKMDEVREKNMEKELKRFHYYGGVVRNLYMAMAVIMLFMTPFLKNELPVPPFISVAAVLGLAVFAGFTSPKAKSIIFYEFIISLVALYIFGYEMVVSYGPTHTRLLFWTSTVLAILAVFTLYFSSKTFRGQMLPD